MRFGSYQFDLDEFRETVELIAGCTDGTYLIRQNLIRRIFNSTNPYLRCFSMIRKLETTIKLKYTKNATFCVSGIDFSLSGT